MRWEANIRRHFLGEKGRIVMKLPTIVELESWSKKFREMFR
jgi:hypothetical protein